MGVKELLQRIIPPPTSPPPVKRRYDAMFIGPSVRQCEYWVRQWGYEPRRVAFITNEQQIRGWGDWDMPVYGCGSHPPGMWDEIYSYIEIHGGVPIIDAQNIQ